MRFWRKWAWEGRKEDLNEEIRAHLQMAAEARMARGESPEEALAGARRELGSLPLIEDVTREGWGSLGFERLLQDVAYGLRQIRRNPGFAAAVIGTLAIGIAAATAMFTVVDHALLRPLPYRDAYRLVAIEEIGSNNQPRAGEPWQDIQQWMAQSHSFEQIALSDSMRGRNFLVGNIDSLQIDGVTVSANLFSTLGVEPALGRNFEPEPLSSSAGVNGGTIILSDSAWKGAYGADPAILGKSVTVDNSSYAVVGVMPPGFEFPSKGSSPKVWIPLTLGEHDGIRDYMSPNYSVIARLRRGVSVKIASAELSTIQKRIAPGYTDVRVRQAHSDARVESYADSLVAADLRKALLALLASAGVLWLIASVNATNLLLARSVARQREIAMRGALGASRLRIAQQFLAEGFLLSGLAALLGTALALAAVRFFAEIKPSQIQLDLSTQMNFVILAALGALSVMTAVIASAWPAYLAVRAPIEPALKQGSVQSGTSRRHRQVRSILVAAEVAMSLVLLVACGLLLRTIYTLRHAPLGYRTDHIVVASLSIPSFRFAGGNVVVDLYEPLLERVKHLSGVQAAGYMSEVPLGQTFNIQLTLAINGQSTSAKLKPVSPDVQRIFGFKMLAGRFFNDGDTATSQPVVVVNRAFAEVHSPDKHNPRAILGQQLLNLRKGARTVIVGVLDDQRQTTIAEPSQPEVEICLPQLTPDSGMYQPATIAMDLAVRTDHEPKSIIADLRSLLRQASPELANATFATMDQVVEDSFGSQRLAANLLEFFGASALLLSAAGLYGLLAWVVTQRTREMGVRIALGAQRSDVLWLVLRQAGVMLLAGIAAGAALAFSTARLLRGYVYGVGVHDGWTLGGAGVLLFVSGIVAAYVPARRAARVNPLEALRAE